MTLRHLEPLIGYQGLLSVTRAWSPDNHVDIMGYVQQHGTVKGEAARKGYHFEDDGAESGPWLLKLGGDVTLMVTFLSATQWVRDNRIEWDFVNYDPSLCTFYEDCTCEQGEDEWTEECSYCDMGSDYCTTHSEYHY